MGLISNLDPQQGVTSKLDNVTTVHFWQVIHKRTEILGSKVWNIASLSHESRIVAFNATAKLVQIAE
jgi:hypothetical protein